MAIIYKTVHGVGRGLKATATGTGKGLNAAIVKPTNKVIVKPTASGARWVSGKKVISKPATATGHGLGKTAGVAGHGLKRGVGKPLASAFNWATGNTSLKKNGLERGEKGLTAIGIGTIVPGYVGIIAAACAVTGPLAPALGGAAATALIGGSRIQAAYIVGKHKTEVKKAAKAEAKKQQAAAPSA